LGVVGIWMAPVSIVCRGVMDVVRFLSKRISPHLPPHGWKRGGCGYA
jgi:hypothetical protein